MPALPEPPAGIIIPPGYALDSKNPAIPYFNPNGRNARLIQQNPGLLHTPFIARLDGTTRSRGSRVLPDGSVQRGGVKSLKLSVTNACNFKCKFCGAPDVDGKATFMDWAFFVDLADEIKDFGIEEVGLFFDGNSTLARKLLLRMLQYLKKIGIPYVFLTDNATAATPDQVKELLAEGLGCFKWSVNGTLIDFTDITGCQVTLYYHALSNIRAAWEIREEGQYDCSLAASSICFNENRPLEMAPFLEKYILPYVDSHYWLSEFQMGGGAAVSDMLKLGGKPVLGNPGRYTNNPPPPLPCFAVLDAAHVTVDGQLCSCCFPVDFAIHPGHKMADLTKMSLEDGLNVPEFTALRRAHLLGMEGIDTPEGINGKSPCYTCVTRRNPDGSIAF